jgi:hypothetical protein
MAPYCPDNGSNSSPGIVETGLADHLEDFNQEVADITAVAKKNTGRDLSLGTGDDQFKTIAQGIATTLAAALDPRIESSSGMYMMNCKPTETYEYVEDPENAERLWKISEELIGEKFEV